MNSYFDSQTFDIIPIILLSFIIIIQVSDLISNSCFLTWFAVWSFAHWSLMINETDMKNKSKQYLKQFVYCVKIWSHSLNNFLSLWSLIFFNYFQLAEPGFTSGFFCFLIRMLITISLFFYEKLSLSENPD